MKSGADPQCREVARESNTRQEILGYRYKLCGAEWIYQDGEEHTFIKRGHSVGFTPGRGHDGLATAALCNILHTTAAFINVSR